MHLINNIIMFSMLCCIDAGVGAARTRSNPTHSCFSSFFLISRLPLSHSGNGQHINYYYILPGDGSFSLAHQIGAMNNREYEILLFSIVLFIRAVKKGQISK